MTSHTGSNSKRCFEAWVNKMADRGVELTVTWIAIIEVTATATTATDAGWQMVV